MSSGKFVARKYGLENVFVGKFGVGKFASESLVSENLFRKNLLDPSALCTPKTPPTLSSRLPAYLLPSLSQKEKSIWWSGFLFERSDYAYLSRKNKLSPIAVSVPCTTKATAI